MSDSTALENVNVSTSLATIRDEVAKVIIKGDLGSLTENELLQYYTQLCGLYNLDPNARPFEILTLKGKKVLYVTRNGTEQLRKNNGISCVPVASKVVDGIYVVETRVYDKAGREDYGTGAVPIRGLTPDDFANAIMKAETKSKRRATLSISGLGMLDESELDTLQSQIDKPRNVGNLSPEVAAAAIEVDNLHAELSLLARSGKMAEEDKLAFKNRLKQAMLEHNPLPTLKEIKEELALIKASSSATS